MHKAEPDDLLNKAANDLSYEFLRILQEYIDEGKMEFMEFMEKSEDVNASMLMSMIINAAFKFMGRVTFYFEEAGIKHEDSEKIREKFKEAYYHLFTQLEGKEEQCEKH